MSPAFPCLPTVRLPVDHRAGHHTPSLDHFGSTTLETLPLSQTILINQRPLLGGRISQHLLYCLSREVVPAPPPHQVDKHLLNFGIIVRSVEDKAGVLLISHLGCVSYRTCESWCVEAVCLAVLVVGGLIVFVSFCKPGVLYLGGKGGGESLEGHGGVLTGLPCPWRAAKPPIQGHRPGVRLQPATSATASIGTAA